MALDWVQNFVYVQYLVDQLMDFNKIFVNVLILTKRKVRTITNYFSYFSTELWPMMSEFYFHLISREQIDGF